MTEPIEFLKSYCEFNTLYDCYVLLAVSRKKDSPDITNSQEICFREVIRKPESIENKYNIIKTLATNYRKNGKKYPFYIYVTVNNCDARKASMKVGQIIFDNLYAEVKGEDRSINFKRMGDTFISELMKNKGSTRYFMIDLDIKNQEFKQRLISDICTGGDILKIIRETRHGFHIITRPFNTMKIHNFLYKEFKDFPINKNGLLFLEYVKND